MTKKTVSADMEVTREGNDGVEVYFVIEATAEVSLKANGFMLIEKIEFSPLPFSLTEAEMRRLIDLLKSEAKFN